jgi:hypothetical protein
MDETMLATLVVAGFLVGFPLVWCAVVLLLSYVGGWQRMAAVYATDKPPRGRSFAWVSARIGFVNYRNCLHVHVAPEGLHLATPWLFRIGHRPLLVPWSAVHGERSRRFLWLQVVDFEVGQPRLARVQLPQKVFDARAAAR